MLETVKRILGKIRGDIIKDKEDQTSMIASVPSKPVESSSPAPLTESPPLHVPMTESPPPPADPSSD